MINHLLSASILLVAVLVIRGIFGKHMSQRVKYALWLLVAVKFMLPVSLPESPVSIYNLLDYGMEYAQQAKEMITETKETKTFENNMESTKTLQQTSNGEAEETTNLTEAENVTNNEWNEKKEYITEDGEKKQEETELVNTNEEKQEAKDVGQLLLIIWVIGTCLVGGFFIISNLYYSNRLKKYSILDDTVQGPCKVYVCDKVESPCLAGVFNPVIYLTKECYETEEIKKYILAHEQEHYYHLDHIWNLIRSMCLACYWFHPLVWIGVMLSKKDSELACDEGVLARLGEQERKAYGNTLIFMAAKESSIGGYFTVAAGMTGGKREMKERVEQIAKKKKHLAGIGIVAVAFVLGVAFATFSQKDAENTTQFTEKQNKKERKKIEKEKVVKTNNTTEEEEYVDTYEIVLDGTTIVGEEDDGNWNSFCDSTFEKRQLTIYELVEDEKKEKGVLKYEDGLYTYEEAGSSGEQQKIEKWYNLQILAGEATKEGTPLIAVLCNKTYNQASYTYEQIKKRDETKTDFKETYPYYILFSAVMTKEAEDMQGWVNGLHTYTLDTYIDDIAIENGVMIDSENTLGKFIKYCNDGIGRYGDCSLTFWEKTDNGKRIIEKIYISRIGSYDYECTITTYKQHKNGGTYGVDKKVYGSTLSLYYNPQEETYQLGVSNTGCSQLAYKQYLNYGGKWAKEKLEELNIICSFKE